MRLLIGGIASETRDVRPLQMQVFLGYQRSGDLGSVSLSLCIAKCNLERAEESISAMRSTVKSEPRLQEWDDLRRGLRFVRVLCCAGPPEVQLSVGLARRRVARREHPDAVRLDKAEICPALSGSVLRWR